LIKKESIHLNKKKLIPGMLKRTLKPQSTQSRRPRIYLKTSVKMAPKKARLKDIAILSGVSIGTIDRVLHNRGEVAEKTRLKVQKILKETNYSPNVMAQVLKSKKRFHLVSLLPDPEKDNSFWQKHSIGMTRAVEDLDPFPVSLSQITFDMQSETDFQQKSNIVLKLKPDGILLAPIFKSESIAFCSRLKNENIPFVFIDGFIENTDFLAYIGEDIFQSGRVAGQLIDIVTPGKRDIIIATVARNIVNVHHLNNRNNGFLNYFQTTGNNKGEKINVNIPEPSLESIKVELDKAFDNNHNIGSIFFTGSRSYLIASYLKEEGIKGISIVGYDLLDLNVQSLKSGIISFLIGQRPEEQSYKGIKKLFEFLSLNKIPEKIEYLPVDIITSENVDYFR
jgi:LacI family transcriptional regulator